MTWNTLRPYRTGDCHNLSDVIETYVIQIIAFEERSWPGRSQLELGNYVVYFFGKEETFFWCDYAVHETLEPHVK